MGLYRFAEGIALVDGDLHLAAGHHVDEVFRRLLQVSVGGSVGVERRPRDIERALGGKLQEEIGRAHV